MYRYDKGDTIELLDGRVAIVLNNGMGGVKFYDQYGGIMVKVVGPNNVGAWVRVSTSFCRYFEHCLQYEHVWYYVLFGDQKGWATELSMSRWIT